MFVLDAYRTHRVMWTSRWLRTEAASAGPHEIEHGCVCVFFACVCYVTLTLSLALTLSPLLDRVKCHSTRGDVARHRVVQAPLAACRFRRRKLYPYYTYTFASTTDTFKI